MLTVVERVSGPALEIMADYTEGQDKLHLCYSFAMLGPAFSAAHFRNALTALR